MSKNDLQAIIMGLVLILAQAIVFDNVCLFNVAVPFVFIYVIFKLPMTMGVNSVLIISFLLGLMIDIFADTYGMNALASTVTAMTRRGVLNLYIQRGDEPADPVPSFKSIGRGPYIKYMATMTLIYCVLIFAIESFTFFNFWLTVARVTASTALSLVLMLGVDFLTVRRREKRL